METSRERSTPENQNTILVVGDWVVDEYWTLVGHNSTLSTHTGAEHLRVSNEPEPPIRDLCGAGHVARVLLRLLTKHPNYKLYGLGNWDKSDSDLLLHLLHPEDCEVSKPGFVFGIGAGACDKRPNIELIPLYADHGTTRVIRLYRRTFPVGVPAHSTSTAELKQLNRIDWEQPGKVPELAGKLPETLSVTGGVSNILYDLRKGAISRAVVKQLADRWPHADWYIRSKDKAPSWLQDIPRGKVRLRIFGPEVAAVRSPVENWIVDHRITYTGFNTLDDEKREWESAVLLSAGRKVVGRLNGTTCITAEAPREANPIAEVGWSSAFFAELAFRAHEKGEITTECIEEALRGADNYSKGSTHNAVGVKCHETAWSDEKSAWQQARQDLGVIKKDGKPVLDIWRGSTDIPGYIACMPKKCDILRQIAEHLNRYKINSGHNLRALSILLRADPGSGKTSLARALADAFAFSFLSCDLTQLSGRDDLLDFFDTIGTKQIEKGENVLVFVDEINALLPDLGAAYSTFLSPLEEGTYVRRRHTFPLRPCVWVFAGTDEKVNGRTDQGPKQQDFMDRLTIRENLSYEFLVNEERVHHGEDGTPLLRAAAQLEQVYLGASMIHKYHPDVKHVSRYVLRCFQALDPARKPARMIRRLATLLTDVQDGEVHWK